MRIQWPLKLIWKWQRKGALFHTDLLYLRCFLLPRYRRIFSPGHQRLNSISQFSSLHVLTTTRCGPQIPENHDSRSKHIQHFEFWTLKWPNIDRHVSINASDWLWYPDCKPDEQSKPRSVRFCQGRIHLPGCRWVFCDGDLPATLPRPAGSPSESHAEVQEERNDPEEQEISESWDN